MAGDIHYNNVSLLLHCDGANNSTTFTDSAPTPKTVTANGNAKVSTTQSKFGGASANFDGITDSLSTPNHSSLIFGTGAFTIECWVYASASGQVEDFPRIMSKGAYNTAGAWNLVLTKSNGLLAFEHYTTTVVYSIGTLVNNTWNHIAIARDNSSVMRGYLNGVEGFSATDTKNLNSTTQLVIGSETTAGASDFTGYIDDVRLTAGVARYTTNFTPDAAAFPNATASLVGDITTTTSVSSVIQMRRKMLIVGSISASVSVSSTLLYHPKKTIVGSIPITIGASATMVYSHPASPIIGDITATIALTATTLKYSHHYVNGDITATITPAATFSEIYAINNIVGSIPISVDSTATTLKYSHHYVNGSIGVPISVSSITLLKQPIYVTGGGFTSSLESYINDFLELTVTGGGFATTLDANFGCNVSGGSFSSALDSTITGIPSLFVSGGAFSSDLSSTITSSSSTSVSGGSFKSALDSNFGANVTGGGFNSSLSATFTGWASLSVSGGSFSSTLDSRIVEVGRINVSGGAFNSALLYMDVVGGGFNTLLDANISNQVSNAVAYVMNVHTSESTRYTNMAFSHIIQIGNKPYGVKPDGLYLLEGATDDGTVISGSITTKNTDLGTYQSKHVPFIYLNSDTDTTVTPIVDEVTKTANDSSFNGRRAKLAKGNKGRYWQFKIDDVIRISGLEIPDEQRQRRVK